MVIKFTLLVETGSMHLWRHNCRRSFSHKAKGPPCDLCYCWLRECKIYKAQETEKPTIESNTQPCFSNVVPASWSNSPTYVQQDAFKSNLVFSLQREVHTFFVTQSSFPTFPTVVIENRFRASSASVTEEEHKNLCFSLAGALRGLMVSVMMLVITWGVGGRC